MFSVYRHRWKSVPESFLGVRIPGSEIKEGVRKHPFFPAVIAFSFQLAARTAA
jgi:hypothetical protein